MAKILVFQHSPFEPLGILVPLIKARRIRIRFLNFYRQNNFQINLENYQGVIVLGGPQNPLDFEKHPHLVNELKWMENALKLKLPILGICLGAQLLSQALGGKLFKLNVPEFGWHKILIKEKNRFLDQLYDEQLVFQWHQYGFESPNSSTLLAENQDGLAQSFSYENALALQCHLEVDQALCDRWLHHTKYLEFLSQHLPETEIDAIRKHTALHIKRSEAYAIKTFSHFLDLIAPQPIILKSNHGGK